MRANAPSAGQRAPRGRRGQKVSQPPSAVQASSRAWRTPGAGWAGCELQLAAPELAAVETAVAQLPSCPAAARPTLVVPHVVQRADVDAAGREAEQLEQGAVDDVEVVCGVVLAVRQQRGEHHRRGQHNDDRHGHEPDHRGQDLQGAS